MADRLTQRGGHQPSRDPGFRRERERAADAELCPPDQTPGLPMERVGDKPCS